MGGFRWFARCCAWVFAFFIAAGAGGAILGDDDRIDVHEDGARAFARAATATAAMILDDRSALVPTPVGHALRDDYPSYAASDGMCRDVRFGAQPAPAYCTAFLVADDRLLTAAHCVKDHELGEFLFVFDFATDARGRVRTVFDRSRAFRGVELVASDPEEDWAVVRLDRGTGREPLSLRKRGTLRLGTPVVIVGHPHGLPTKVAGGARVVAQFYDPPSELWFEATLDAFGGNSGSPVLNAKTGEVEGIYAVGFGEYEDGSESDGRPCRRPRRWPDVDDATPGWSVRVERFRKAALSGASPAHVKRPEATPDRRK